MLNVRSKWGQEFKSFKLHKVAVTILMGIVNLDQYPYWDKEFARVYNHCRPHPIYHCLTASAGEVIDKYVMLLRNVTWHQATHLPSISFLCVSVLDVHYDLAGFIHLDDVAIVLSTLHNHEGRVSIKCRPKAVSIA
jgi:hypothetical protein